MVFLRPAGSVKDKSGRGTTFQTNGTRGWLQ
jgi:hypothetical protein